MTYYGQYREGINYCDGFMIFFNVQSLDKTFDMAVQSKLLNPLLKKKSADFI